MEAHDPERVGGSMRLFLITELEAHFIEEHGLSAQQLGHIRKLCQSNGVSYLQILEVNDAKLHAGQPDPQDLAWLAGLYEGEGCLVRKHDTRNDTVSWELSISSTDEDVIRRAHAVARVGSINFIKRQKPHWSDKYRWRVSKRDHIARVINEIIDQLGIRRRVRVEEFLGWYAEVSGIIEVRQGEGKSEHMMQTLRELGPHHYSKGDAYTYSADDVPPDADPI